jgi:fermentation-respiration switch protein FrsA (DUF1100 family)
MSEGPLAALKWIAAAGVFGVILILLIFWVTQRSMIYYPSAEVPEPSVVGLTNVERVVMPTRDGLQLHGWFVPATAPATGDSIIVFNGNAGHRALRADLAHAFGARGWSTLLFDYRGYGGNPGSPTEEGLALDALAARAYLEGRRDIDPRRIVYFGESLGSGVAVRLALTRAPRALVLRSPLLSLAATARYHFPYLPVGLLLRERYASAEAIGRIRCPVVVITAAHDSIVPAEHSRRLYQLANEPKRLVVIGGADHNDEALTSGPRVIDAVAESLSWK